MRAKLRRITAAVFVILITAFCFMIPVAALDDTYRIEDLGITMKFPKGDYVITRDTPRGDAVFDAVDLDYDETMTAFKAANIYLRAYDPDNVYQISLIVTKDENSEAVNNYADLTTAERKEILDAFESNNSIQSAVEVKRNNNIFFDTESETEIDSETVYINQCNTIVNGMQIDLMLQKSEEKITPEEAQQLTNAANAMSFDDIRSGSGPAFDWWRMLLWIVILVAISIAVTFIYKQYHAANQRKMEARMQRHRTTLADYEEARHAEEEPEITFEESLGYKDEEEFTARAAADEMAGTDISVQEKDPNKGINFFEDEGESIDDGTKDYFDTYFKEPTEKRSAVQRFFSAIWSYIKIAATHTGYFFKNLYLKLVAKIKSGKK